MVLSGRARDLTTSSTGEPSVVAEDGLRLVLDAARTIVSAATEPHREIVDALVGVGCGSHLRAALEVALANERAAASPLCFLLDDVSILSRIGGVAWAQHRPFELPKLPAGADPASFHQTRSGAVACSGLRPGGYHDQSHDKGNFFPHFLRFAGDLSTSDEVAWHEVEEAPPVCMRRRRRIDAWRDGGLIHVDAHYRDSVWGPQQDELALHEYGLAAIIDGDSHEIRSIDATGLVLPFPECPHAVAHVDKLVGTPVDALRPRVQAVLAGIQCCTHLNDMLRGLSEVPRLCTP